MNLGVDESRLLSRLQDADREGGQARGRRRGGHHRHAELHSLTRSPRPASRPGLHVICEKPLFFTVKECEEIATLADDKGLDRRGHLRLTGHPLVHQMAAMVKKGMLGDIRIVDLQYTHGFNSGRRWQCLRAVKWRTNPKTSGSDLRARRYRHAHLLPVGNRPAAHEDRETAVRPQGIHQVARAAGGQRLRADALRQRRASAGSGCPRSTPATWAPSAAALSARKPRSNGATRIPTSSSTRFRDEPAGHASRHALSRESESLASIAWAPCTPRASATAGPTSIFGSPRPSTRRCAATRRS